MVDELEHRPLPGMAQHSGPQGEPGVQAEAQFPFPQGHRHGGGGPGQHRGRLHGDLHPAGGPGLRPDGTGQLHAALLPQPLGQYVRGAHALDAPPCHAQGEEYHAPHVPQGVDRAVDGDGPVIQPAPRKVLPDSQLFA